MAKKKKKKFTILYVDDEKQNLISFKAAFRRDYSVKTALSGKEGMAILKKKNIHLIISDQRMPEMTGVQFLEKTLPENPDSIRMILTGFSDISAIINAINHGKVFRYVTKPWDERELKMTIENARQLYSLNEKNKILFKFLQQKVKEQEKTLKLFEKYVPAPVVEKVLRDSEDSIFEGELRKVAVLFCDIRGFTPICEKVAPKEIVSLLNDYYSLMTKSIKRYNGYVNQFVGDEVFAVFGAPINYNNNEENAVFCAVEMLELLKILNKKYIKILGEEIKIGIGINYGEVIAGNLGSEDRIDYSVTGDTVNTGKRIESLTKKSPNSILISENVYEKTKHLIKVKPWEAIFVKGKKEKIYVYEILKKIDNF